jgi:transcription initiation factor TFIIB
LSLKKKDKKLNTTQKNKNKDIFKIIDDMENNKNLIDYLNPNLDIDSICKECNSLFKITDEGFYCCSNNKCSIINKDVLDNGPEWRYYHADDNNNSDPTRCGMPTNPLLKESSFSCLITCNSKSNLIMRTVKRYSDWSMMPYNEKAKYDDFNIITNLASAEGIPKIIIEDAIRYYNKISDEKSFRGLNRDGIIAASIYIACRIENYPRTAEEIAHIFLLDRTSATKGCKNAMCIINEIEQSKPMQNMLKYSTTNPFSFMERFCTSLHMNEELTKLAQFIAKQIEKKNMIPENTPKSIAAGIIYFLSQEFNLNLTKTDIETKTFTSEVTINKCYQKINLLKHSLIPSSIYEKYKS